MKTRKHNWFDAQKRVVMFSFQVQCDGVWATPIEEGRPCIYFNERDRDAVREQYRRLKHETKI